MNEPYSYTDWTVNLPPLVDLKDQALTLFINERLKVAEDWGISTKGYINPLMLAGIDAEANERIRIRLIAALAKVQEQAETIDARAGRLAP